MTNFNPLRREGGDLKGSVQKEPFLIFQSTPPRGRRPTVPGGCCADNNFNPLRREGGDHPGYQGKDIRSNFNPLRREGGDQTSETSTRESLDFNPLRREGGDDVLAGTGTGHTDFNPLRREGGDPGWFPRTILTIISIHSAARAETQAGPWASPG